MSTISIIKARDLKPGDYFRYNRSNSKIWQVAPEVGGVENLTIMKPEDVPAAPHLVGKLLLVLKISAVVPKVIFVDPETKLLKL